MGTIIRFGTDGWRARVDGDFSEENLVRVADAVGRVWAQEMPGAIVYVGYDTRPGAEHFACLAGRVLASHGLVAKVSDRYVPTPALSWATARDVRACGGFQVTGSHHPHDYLGVKLRSAQGGTLSGDAVRAIEDAIDPDPTDRRGAIERCDYVTPYFDYLCTSVVDADVISQAKLRVLYDPLYGSARGYVPLAMGSLGIETIEIHGAPDDEYEELHPDCMEPWIDACEQAVVNTGVSAGLINDGDADRVGAVDEHGRFVSTHRIIALLIGHLVKHRGMTGRVVLNQSTSMLTRRVARDLGCRVTVKPVGFKHIYEESRKGDVLIGGEEAGGVGIPAFCPERDGILVTMLLCELMAMTGKSLGTLSDELTEAYGAASYGRRDLRLQTEVVEMFRTLLPGLNPQSVAGRTPVAVSHMDGLRLEFEDESWLLMRPAGTEPVVRVYAEAPTVQARDELLEAGCDIAKGELGI